MKTRVVVAKRKQNPAITALTDSLAHMAGQPTRDEAQRQSICAIGGHPVTFEEYQSWSRLDQKEYGISGCCPACWKKLFE